jgi:hypothetical protein
MMRKALGSGIVALVVLLAVGGVYAIHELNPAETRVPMPGADAGALHGYIMKDTPYKSWQLWPGKGRLYEGVEPHGSFLTTYVNDTAYRSITQKEGMKDGSIIVKENYSKDKEFMFLTVMYMIKGYNPDAGDWFWAKYDRDGSVMASGKVEGCIKCHGRRKDNDYIYTGTVK